MSALNNGGPAFPGVKRHCPPGTEPYDVPYGGMSLRDYFAAKAMAVLIEKLNHGDARVVEVSRCAFHFADAMLAERQKGDAK